MRRPANARFNGNAFKLGLFSSNGAGGMAIATVPERWQASWDNNLKLAQMADAAGIEFLLPIARWTAGMAARPISRAIRSRPSPGLLACSHTPVASPCSRPRTARSRSR